jgi:cytochrome c556
MSRCVREPDCIRRWRAFAVVAGLLLVPCAGCGRNPASPQASGTASDDSAQSADAVAVSESTSESRRVAKADSGSGAQTGTHARDEIWIDEKGQKWFGNVPLDAFFDEPYSIASNQTPLVGSAAAANGTVAEKSSESIPAKNDTAPDPAAPVGAEPKATATAGSDAAAGGDDSWDALITATALDEEVKAIRNFMNENLQSVGTFNSSMLMLPPKAAALAALAEVAAKHPEAVSWKEDAAYLRDLGKQMNSAALQRGAKDQKRMLELYEAVSDTLNRSRPASLEDPPATDSFAEAAEMRLLMMRMEEAEKRMRTEAGTEAAMASRRDLIVHEASMMAVMAKIVTEQGYGYEDDAEFKGYSSEIVQSAQAIKAAAASGDFASYEGALSKITTTCQNCHSKYKND